MRWLTVLTVLLAASVAEAQTVDGISDRGACSTSGVEGLSRQLAEEQMCLRPGGFVRFAPHPNITLSSGRVHPYAQAAAAMAIQTAASSRPLTINSAFRTLADQYVLFHSGGCGLAARPGRSNHQSGRAIDVQNHSSARSALQSAGCAWFGSSDAVHFDCPGGDMRNDSVQAFQRLWNRNNPSDRIAEDGLYGPQTESRLSRAPAGGFPVSGCTTSCTPRCEGDGFVDASCNHTSCAGGQICDESGAPRCVAPMPTEEATAIGVAYVDQGTEDTSTRIPGATVRVVETGLSATADMSGVWQLAVGPGTYTLEASAPGYGTARRTCTVSAGAEPTWCSIGMTSDTLGSGTLRGVVYDLDRGIQERVVDAVVVLATSGEVVNVNPADGSFTFEVAPGEHVLEAGGDGVAPASATCLVMADDTTWCSIGVRGEDGAPLNTVTVTDPIPDDGSGMPPVGDMPLPDPEDGPRGGPGRSSVSGCSVSEGASGTRGSLALFLLLGALLYRRRR